MVDELNRLAAEHNTSFNNIVVTMIEQCLDDVKFNSIAVTMIEQCLEDIKKEEEQEG